jgi:hypothetical protein
VTPETQSYSENDSDIPLAIVLDGVSEKWQCNIVEILGRRTVDAVTVDGYGTIHAPAIILGQRQARHLATQITEILGPENKSHVREHTTLENAKREGT